MCIQNEDIQIFIKITFYNKTRCSSWDCDQSKRRSTHPQAVISMIFQCPQN